MSSNKVMEEKTSPTYNKILEAAISIFSNKGYHDTKVDDIVEESEISKGGVYFHFPSKQSIFLSIIDRFSSLLEERLLDAVSDQERGVDKIDAALNVCMGTFEEYKHLAKIFLVQAVGLGAVFEVKRLQIHDRFVSIIKSYLDQAVAEGAIEEVDTEVVAYAWMGAIDEIVIRWVHTGYPYLDRVMPSLRLTLLRSIGIDTHLKPKRSFSPTIQET